MEAFDSRLPVSVGALWLMEHDTRRAIKTAPGGGVVEPEAVVEEGPSEETGLVQVAVAPVAEEEAAVCPECGAALRSGVQFCGKCGHSLGEEEDEAAEAEPVAEETVGEQCPECGQSLREGVQFCGKCGHRLDAAEEEAAEPEAEEPPVEEAEQPEPTVEEAIADTCAECGKPVEPDWQVCPYCGKKTRAECPECGKAAEPDWVACPYCGASLAAG
jgi:predicted amidophosphoribosyltransferase